MMDAELEEADENQVLYAQYTFECGVVVMATMLLPVD